MLQKYIIFAVISTIINISTQAICLETYKGKFEIYLAICCGTLTGLLSKYYLDKRFVFQHSSSGYIEEGKVFFLYSLMGVFTTLIFWIVEILFHYIIEYNWSKYVGAVTGLTIGYIIKFYLDQKFVFKKNL